MLAFGFCLRWTSRLVNTREDICHPIDSMPFSCTDLIWGQLMLGRDLLNGSVAMQRVQSHLQ